MSQATLSVALSTDQANIKVNGRATFECTENLKFFCSSALAKNISSLYINMQNCTGMDSTFMGMLAKISMEARKKKIEVAMILINKENKKNLFSLGLKKLFTFPEQQDVQGDKWTDLETTKTPQVEQRQNIIDAHQTLIDVHEDNRQEFQDIVDFLNAEKSSEQE
jgi:anti-sigma B factor antagonist